MVPRVLQQWPWIAMLFCATQTSLSWALASSLPRCTFWGMCICVYLYDIYVHDICVCVSALCVMCAVCDWCVMCGYAWYVYVYESAWVYCLFLQTCAHCYWWMLCFLNRLFIVLVLHLELQSSKLWPLATFTWTHTNETWVNLGEDFFENIYTYSHTIKHAYAYRHTYTCMYTDVHTHIYSYTLS